MADIKDGSYYWVLPRPTIESPKPEWEVARATREQRFGFLAWRWAFINTHDAVYFAEDLSQLHEIERPE